MAGPFAHRKLPKSPHWQVLPTYLHVVILPGARLWARRGRRVLGDGSRWRSTRRKDIRKQGVRRQGTGRRGTRWLLVVAEALGWDPV